MFHEGTPLSEVTRCRVVCLAIWASFISQSASSTTCREGVRILSAQRGMFSSRMADRSPSCERPKLRSMLWLPPRVSPLPV